MSWHLPELCCRYGCAQLTFVHPQPLTHPPRWPCPVLIPVNVLWICPGMWLLTVTATVPLPSSSCPSAPCPLPPWAPSPPALAGQLLLSQKITELEYLLLVSAPKWYFVLSWTENHSLTWNKVSKMCLKWKLIKFQYLSSYMQSLFLSFNNINFINCHSQLPECFPFKYLLTDILVI